MGVRDGLDLLELCIASDASNFLADLISPQKDKERGQEGEIFTS